MVILVEVNVALKAISREVKIDETGKTGINSDLFRQVL